MSQFNGINYFDFHIPGIGRRHQEVDYMDVIKPHFILKNPSKKNNNTKKNEENTKNTNNININTYLNNIDKISQPNKVKEVQQTVDIDNNTKTTCADCSKESNLYCTWCQDYFCNICYKVNHRSGKRTLHVSVPVDTNDINDKEKNINSRTNLTVPSLQKNASDNKNNINTWFRQRSKYIPIRLTHQERKFLRLVDDVFRSCNYLQKVDRPEESFRGKAGRKYRIAQEILSILAGIITATDWQLGKDVLLKGTINEYQTFQQYVFELGRRHKIRNPEKMRTSYYTQICQQQDIKDNDIQQIFGINVIRPIFTVYTILEDLNCQQLLDDPRLLIATQEISWELGREEKQHLTRKKNIAIQDLAQSYSNSHISKQTLLLCIYSICDNHNFLRSNKEPCDIQLQLLQKYYSPTNFTNDIDCLSISRGIDGSTVTHSHTTQYAYVYQTLLLWSEILMNFFYLWWCSEEDLLDVDTIPYKQEQTIQGLCRIQYAPRTDRAMREILVRVQQKQKTNEWIGSTVIHLGDNNVPNALYFIDKYKQIGKILSPVVLCIQNLQRISNECAAVEYYIKKTFNSIDGAILTILTDLFRKGFDGSGGDTFMDQGSCVDGRLTSLSSWRTALPTKIYYPLFQFTRTTELDGSDWEG